MSERDRPDESLAPMGEEQIPDSNASPDSRSSARPATYLPLGAVLETPINRPQFNGDRYLGWCSQLLDFTEQLHPRGAEDEMERSYTVHEIDDLRRVVEHKWLWGSYGINPIRAGEFTFTTSRSYKPEEMIKAVEERVRTHMLAGHTASDLLDSEKADYPQAGGSGPQIHSLDEVPSLAEVVIERFKT